MPTRPSPAPARRSVAACATAAFVALAPVHGGSTPGRVGAGALPTFSDVTAAAGIQISGLGNASSWIDFDRDGLLDLFATDSDFPSHVYLYRNDGGGIFTDVTVGAGLGGASLRSEAWGDYDNDGWPDLAGNSYSVDDRTHLYHNNGDGTFTDVSRSAHMKVAHLSWRVSWADFNRDGWLDLYQANNGANFLYQNVGDGTFTEVAQQAGVAGGQSTADAAWGDEDGDGWPDLYVANDGSDHLYRNNGDGTFTDVTATAQVSDAFDSVSACWGDYDDDSRLDLYVVNIGAFRRGGTGMVPDAITNRLYHNNGDGTFSNVTATAGVGDVGDGRTCTWLDVDNDGRLDLYATNHIHSSRLYRNLGNGSFTDVAATIGLKNPYDVFNGAWGDYDGDGDLDLFTAGHAGNELLRSDGLTAGFLEVELTGSASNRSAIGARVFLILGGGKRPNRQVEGSTGAYGQDSLAVEFGLGQARGPFRLRILWPSGATQSLSGVSASRYLRVTEPFPGRASETSGRRGGPP